MANLCYTAKASIDRQPLAKQSHWLSKKLGIATVATAHPNHAHTGHAKTGTRPQLPETTTAILSSHTNIRKPLVIGIIAGEASGDSLGADLMAQFNNLTDQIVWVGTGGNKMQQQGLHPVIDMQRLAVMGLVEVLSHLPDLFKARRELITAFTEADIDLFIGIDAPDFNLRVAKKLKPKGIFCVQYVSPSVWAWRESRIHGIKSASDLVLCLFPFELPVYQRHKHPAVCVGHPLLYNMDPYLLHTPMIEQRSQLVWDHDGLQQFFVQRYHEISHLICVMPGSRRGEITAILPLMLDGIQKLLLADPRLCFIIPTIDQNHQYIVQELVEKRNQQLRDAITVIYDGTQADFSQRAMAASDLVLLASGTATLEAMLLTRPMVVVYQLNALTYQLAKRLVKVPYVALPNILAAKPIVPELIQENASADGICRRVTQLLQPRDYQQQRRQLQDISQQLRQLSASQPCAAIISTWMMS